MENNHQSFRIYGLKISSWLYLSFLLFNSATCLSPRIFIILCDPNHSPVSKQCHHWWHKQHHLPIQCKYPIKKNLECITLCHKTL